MREFIFEFGEINSVVNEIKKILEYKHSPLILLNGEMGAGKTTFTRHLVQNFIPNSNPNSPTYSLVNEYQNEDLKIFHFDLYRIKSSEEIFDLGFEEIWKNEFCIIEWWKIAEEFLTRESIQIDILVLSENKRKLNLK